MNIIETRHLFVLALFATLFASKPILAQVWLEPRAGWLIPTKDLGQTDIFDNTGFAIFARADQSVFLGLGAGVDLNARWALKASVDRSFNTAVQGEWRCAPFVACPDVLLPLEGELSFWTIAIYALHRFPGAFSLNPIVFAGIGLRRSELDWNQPAADIVLPAFSYDETRAAYRLGAGLEYSIGTATIFTEVEATATRFGGGLYKSIEGNVDADRKLLLDMGLQSGVRLRLR